MNASPKTKESLLATATDQNELNPRPIPSIQEVIDCAERLGVPCNLKTQRDMTSYSVRFYENFSNIFGSKAGPGFYTAFSEKFLSSEPEEELIKGLQRAVETLSMRRHKPLTMLSTKQVKQLKKRKITARRVARLNKPKRPYQLIWVNWIDPSLQLTVLDEQFEPVKSSRRVRRSRK